MRSIYSVFILSLIAVESLAGRVTSEVSFIQVNSGTAYPDIAAIKFKNMPTNSPACASDAHGRMAVSLTTEGGKAVYAMALAAQASGRKLDVYGRGVCIAGALEEIDYIRIAD